MILILPVHDFHHLPLTRRAAAVIAAWLEMLPEAAPDAHVFPRHTVGFGKDGKGFRIANIDFSRPMRGWKSAWSSVRTTTNVKARWHDLRHTLVSRLAENRAVSGETIRALAGHVSRNMLSRYAHIRAQAKRAAIATLDATVNNSQPPDAEGGSPQNPPQLVAEDRELRLLVGEKCLN